MIGKVWLRKWFKGRRLDCQEYQVYDKSFDSGNIYVCNTMDKDIANIVAVAPEMLLALINIARMVAVDSWIYYQTVPVIERATGMPWDEVRVEIDG